MFKYIFQKIIILSVFSLVLTPAIVVAEESDFMPNVLNGQLTVTTEAGNVYYGGLGGNEAVTNWEDDYIFAFNQNSSYGCAGVGDISLLVPCLVLSSPSTPAAVTTLRSQTFLNGTPEIETAALLYPRNSIFGDVYGTSSLGLPGFNQFGKNLYQSGGSTSGSTAFYKIGNYKFNPNAQAAWNSGNNKAMTDTITRLKRDAKGLQANNVVLSTRNWNTGLANFDGVCGSLTTCSEENQYPEGRVWGNSSDTGNINIGFGATLAPNPLTYDKKSTLLVQSGNLNIKVNVKKKNASSSLGFIVENGNVTIQNLSAKKITVEASIFAPKGTITVIGNNIDLIGSFVAANFSVGATASNVNFIQDTRPSGTWPPGFRDLLPLSRTNN